MRVVTDHGSDAQQERSGSGSGSTHQQEKDRNQAAVLEGSDLAAGRDVLDRQREETSTAGTTEGPGQPPGNRTRRGTARLRCRAVRGHARPARRPDRPQLQDRPRPARSLVCGRLDEVRSALGRSAAVRLAHEPRQCNRGRPLPHLAAQPRPCPPHRGGHQRSPAPRTPTTARPLGVRTRARQEGPFPLALSRPPPRRDPPPRHHDGDRG